MVKELAEQKRKQGKQRILEEQDPGQACPVVRDFSGGKDDL